MADTDQLFYFHNFVLSVDLFHGNAAFKPPDWRIKLTPIVNVNYLTVEELAQVNPDVTKGTSRAHGWVTLQEWFVEKKLADLSPNYDFVSVRAGSQPFNSDFRGFIFNDVNRAVRLFGTSNANRDQFNVAYFRQQEKDTNSLLNSFNDRGQDIFIANYFRQDFIWPGYTSQWSLHYNHDSPSFHFDRNNFLVRPDPVGVFQQHEIDAFYLGWTGDGHINRFNISHAFYWVLGHDTLNPLANQPQDINAQFAAAELSYDRDWVRFRTSGIYASGDGNANNSHATGFDSILDFPNFAGGQFTYWQRQAIPLSASTSPSVSVFCPICVPARCKARAISSIPALDCSTSASISKSHRDLSRSTITTSCGSIRPIPWKPSSSRSTSTISSAPISARAWNTARS